VGAVSLGKETAAEMDGSVINDLGFLVREQLLVAAVRGDERISGPGAGFKGRKGRKGL
jgi:hypothetical protein